MLAAGASGFIVKGDSERLRYAEDFREASARQSLCSCQGPE